MIWAVLAAIWGLQSIVAALVHHVRPAIIMLGMAILFAAVGSIVRQRTAPR